MRRIAMAVGVLAIGLSVTGCGASKSNAVSLSPRRAQIPAHTSGGPCAGQGAGCGSSAGTARALAQARWSTLPSGPLSARNGPVSAWTGAQFLIWGGATATTGAGRFLNDGAAYDPSTRRWTRLPPSPLSPRADASAVWDGNSMLVWGGSTGVGSAHVTASGAMYNPGRHTWTALPASPLSARDSASMVWTGTSAIVFGGVTANGKTSTQGATYSPATRTWTLLPPFPAPAHGSPISASAVWTGGELFVVETYETVHNFHDGFSIKGSTVAAAWPPGGRPWRRLPAPPAEAGLYEATATWTGREVVLTGGTFCLPEMSCPPERYSSVWGYRPTARRWSRLPHGPLITAGEPIVWTGKAIAALAGSTPQTAQVYSPARARWYPLHRNRELGDNAVVLAAWTGRQVLALSLDYRRHGPATTSFYALTPTRSPSAALVSGVLGVGGGVYMPSPPPPCGCRAAAGTVIFIDGQGHRISVKTDKGGRFSALVPPGRYRVVGGLNPPFHWPMGSCTGLAGDGVHFDQAKHVNYLTVGGDRRMTVYVGCRAL